MLGEKGNMRKLIIHVGTPKTGTSALQQFLHNNNDYLKSHGVCYPDFSTEIEKLGYERYSLNPYKNGVVLGRHIVPKIGNLYIKEPEWHCFLERMSFWLAKYDVILSEESIWLWNSAQLLSEIKKNYPNVDIHVVVYLRRQDRYIESGWNQRIKEGNFLDEEFSEYVLHLDKQHDYLERLNLIKSVIDIKNIHVRIYEKESFEGVNGDIFSDFFYTLNIPFNSDKLIKNADYTNQSLPLQYAETKRCMNFILKKYPNYIRVTLENRFRKVLTLLDDGDISNIADGIFTSEERQKVIEGYQLANSEIVRLYLNNDRKNLFQNMDMDIPKADISRPDYNILLKVLTTMLCEQEREIYEVHNKVDQICSSQYKLHKKFLEEIWRRLLDNLDGKTIVLWGAGDNGKYILKRFIKNIDSIHYILDQQAPFIGKICGINVIKPQEIIDWENIFCIITMNAFENAEKYLIEQGLVLNVDYVVAVRELGLYE